MGGAVGVTNSSHSDVGSEKPVADNAFAQFDNSRQPYSALDFT
jgi:hypothetical protein